MKSIKSRLMLALFTLLGVHAIGQTEELSFSLSEARAYAVQHSYFTQKAVLDQEIAERKLKETTAIGLPQIAATADIKRFLDIPTSLMPAEFNPAGGSEPFPVQFGQKHPTT